MTRRYRGALMLQCNMILAACGSSGSSPCTRDDQCASHFCRADGTCGPAEADAAPTDTPGDGISGLCNPNHDGMIDASELPLAAGRMARFRVATDAMFDTAGTSNTDGSRSWDMTGQLANDGDQPIALASPTGTWWAADFPTATYAAPLAAGSNLAGVFRVDAAAVTLLGVVSPDGGAFRTELTYDPPAKILAIPIAAGGTWSSTSTVSGVAQGGVVAYSERYQTRVDQVGMLKAPYGAFPVVRTATDLTRTSGAAVLLTKRSFAWLAECFGAVASVTGKDFDTAAELTQAAEVRRLAP